MASIEDKAMDLALLLFASPVYAALGYKSFGAMNMWEKRVSPG